MGIDWWTFAAQIINLIILLFLLRKFLYIPVLKAVSERQKLIADELKKTESARQQAQKITAECEKRLAQIEVQKQEILKQTNITAEQFAANLKQEAEAQYRAEVENWQNKVISEKETFSLAMQNLIAEYFSRFADSALSQMADVHLNDLVLVKFMEKMQQQVDILPARFANQHNFIIHTAQSLSDENLRQVKEFLQENAAVSATAEFEVKINPELICGVAIEAGGQQISWNLADYMQQFQQLLQNEMMQLLKRS